MRSSRNLPAMQIKVGTLVGIGIVIAFLGVIFPTKGINPFSQKIRVYTHFANVGGLRPSSPVWFSGVEIGEVTEIEFVPGSNPPELKVVMRLERKVQKFIKTDSKAYIKGLGLLGDTYVDISLGSGDAPVVQDQGSIAGVAPADTKQAIDDMMASAKSMLANLEKITQDIQDGKGSLGQLAKDPSLYQELRDAVRELKGVATSLNSENGSAGKLLRDPELYDELVATVKEVRTVVTDLKQTEQKLISPETKQKIDQTVETASRVVKRIGEYQEKIDKIRFDLNFGADKYEGNLAAGRVNLDIWPTDDRYYDIGLQKVTSLYGNETDETTFTGQLAWRIFHTPVFIRGGLIKTESFVAGMDVRLWQDDFKVLLDAYRIEYNPIQVDMRLGVVFLDLIELTAGAEDIARHPFYKAGVTIHYRDDDLLNVIIKTKY